MPILGRVHPADFTHAGSGAAVGRFWRRYVKALADAGIKDYQRPWYRRHVEAYIETHRGKQLTEHDPALVIAFLEVVGG